MVHVVDERAGVLKKLLLFEQQILINIEKRQDGALVLAEIHTICFGNKLRYSI